MVAAFVMAGIKIYGWVATQSIVMLAALLDSLIDGMMSIFIFFSIRYSIQPADKEHRFGHGKAEAVAAFVQGLVLLAAAMFLFVESILSIYQPHVISNISVGIYASSICVAITFLLVLLQSYVVSRTGSLALRSDSLHYRSDILLYASAIITLGLTGYFGDTRLDALFGIGVGIYIVVQAAGIITDSLKQLMDHELSDELRAEIKAVVMKNEHVRGIHDLRTRTSGRRQVIQFHIEMDGEMTLTRAHKISDEVEDGLMAAFPNADIIIHQDPEGLEQLTALEKN